MHVNGYMPIFYATCKQNFRVSIIRKQTITRIHMTNHATNKEIRLDKTTNSKKISYPSYFTRMNNKCLSANYSLG